MDLSTLNALQQGTLFALFILGHAIPIFGIISLLRAWMLRSALRDNSNKDKRNQTVSLMPILQTEEKQMACDKKGSQSAIAIGKAKTITAVREVEAVTSSPCEHEGSWNDFGFIVVTDSRDLDQTQLVTSVPIIDDAQNMGNQKGQILRLTSRLKHKMHRAANRLFCRVSISCNEPGGIEYAALSFIGVFFILYFISFLILGIVSIGLWSKFVRPDIPREYEASPFWAGAFLATSAFCNNGMSLIDTNMGPYQKEYVTRSLQKFFVMAFIDTTRRVFPLLSCGFLILAGNTLFPCLMRFFIWLLRTMLPNTLTWQLWRRTLDFALAQSQNVCAYLYPAWHTWFVLGTILVLNATMWGAFEVSAIHDEEIGSLPIKFRVLDGLFQALGISFWSLIEG